MIIEYKLPNIKVKKRKTSSDERTGSNFQKVIKMSVFMFITNVEDSPL